MYLSASESTQENVTKNDQEKIFSQILTLKVNKWYKYYYSFFMCWASGALYLT